ncbi:39S ribosomal protein L42, mitochondrial [Zeugodacus cucurbitae]|uniref:39S ribosomal protein L42, mitochondrial n=1 Tax=Zeugodacus cucurbitae TaxID=28588 RepID=UPI00059680E2|nr:39S ribosomal protein L42, mitochondrial [Zeugodacus cucurbitae]
MFSSFVRRFSTSGNVASKNVLGGNSLVNKVAITNNGAFCVAWHPEVDFPYERSKPIPYPIHGQDKTLLNDKYLGNTISAFKTKTPEIARQELMQLTYTTKHRWFPRSRDKRAKNTPMDRPYL